MIICGRPLRYLVLPGLVALSLCGSSLFAADPKKPAKTTYAEHVLPILKDACVSCHGADKQRGGLALHTYQALLQGGSSGEVVKPGDADASRLYLLMAHKAQPAMPPKSPKLEQAKLDLVAKWISEGALENAGSKPVVMKPKADVGLTSIVRGRPPVPPLPTKPLPLDPVVKTAKANAITALASSPWAPLVAVGGQKQVLLYNSDTLDLVGVLAFPEGVPQVLKFSRNGSLLLAGGGRAGKSGKVVVWSVATGERIIEVGDETDAVLGADISPDQTQIALGGPGKMIRVYSTKDASLIREIKKHTDWIYSVEYSPDGVLLATADRNGGVFVWEAHTGREYFALRGHTAAVTDLSWRMDSNVLATISEDTTLRLWEMENGGQIKSWGAHGGGGQSVRFTHDNRLVSSGRDRVVKVWDQNGAQQRAFETLPDVAVRATFTHDGARVVTGDWSGQLRVFQTADGRGLGLLAANPLTVAERLEAALKELPVREAALAQTQATLKASEAALAQATANLAAAQKAVADTANAAKASQEAAAKAKAALDAANAALPATQNAAAAKDVLARAFNEAAAKVKAAADAAKTNPALVEAATRAKALADAAAAELTAAQKALADATAHAKAAADHLAKLQQAATAATAAQAQAPKNVEAATAALKAAQAKAVADKAAVDAATAALNEARARVERLKNATAVTKK